MASHPSSTYRSLFVTGLQNAHAVENQALALIDRQLDRLVRYPEVAERLRLHRRETEVQIGRLDEILSGLRERHSSLKDMAMNFMGNFAALSNVMAADEILKNSFVNFAFENFEIASYRSLIALAEAGGFGAAAPLLEATLAEEQAMAAWIEQSLPDLTLKYAALRQGGRVASH
ncbi:MAG TPA: ferritin-like domain-containing protein [Allosphingosinicella sp.]|jgi:ferritin-like metal-binding protein YciE